MLCISREGSSPNRPIHDFSLNPTARSVLKPFGSTYFQEYPMARVLSGLSSILLAWSLSLFVAGVLVSGRPALANPSIMTCSGDYQEDCPSNNGSPGVCNVCCSGGVCQCSLKTINHETGCVCGAMTEECNGYDSDST